jgi:hypothetical protein
MTALARPGAAKVVPGPLAAVVTAGNAVGAACILGNWWRAAGSSDLRADLSSAGLAIAGVVVAGLANALWLLAARGAIARRRRRLSTRVADWAAPLAAPALRVAGSAASPAEAGPPSLASDLIAVDGATLYHRPDCPLVVRKRTAVAQATAHEANGLRPCGVCEPVIAPRQDGALQ